MESNGIKGLVLDEPLIFEKSSPGRVGIGPAHSDVPEADPKKTLGQKFLRDNIEGFPDLSEMDAVRHSRGSRSGTSGSTRASIRSGRAP